MSDFQQCTHWWDITVSTGDSPGPLLSVPLAAVTLLLSPGTATERGCSTAGNIPAETAFTEASLPVHDLHHSLFLFFPLHGSLQALCDGSRVIHSLQDTQISKSCRSCPRYWWLSLLQQVMLHAFTLRSCMAFLQEASSARRFPQKITCNKNPWSAANAELSVVHLFTFLCRQGELVLSAKRIISL